MKEVLDRLAIIILNYNSGELTTHAVKNILNLEIDAKVVVVDNCSTDDSRDILEREFAVVEKVHIVYSDSNGGYAVGNNIGIHVVEKMLTDVDTVLIMNPDIEISDKEILYSMYKTLKEHEELGAITVKTIFNGKVREPNECAWYFMTPQYMALGGTIMGKLFVKSRLFAKEEIEKAKGSEITYMDVVQGCFFMIRLNNLKKIDYLDENTFLYTEESILAKRLEKIGKRNAVLHNYYINHNHKEKNNRLVKYKNKVFDMNCYYSSRKYYIKKYSGQPVFFIFLSQMFLNLDYGIKKMILRMALK